MHSKRIRILFPYLIFAVGCLIIVGSKQISMYRAQQRISIANPISKIASLRGTPVIILSTDLDQGYPLELHGKKVQDVLGSDCTIVQYPAIGMGYVSMYDSKKISAFLKEKVSGKPTIFLLHGSELTADAWSTRIRAAMPTDRARVDLANMLRKTYPCEAVEFGKSSWGNDASVTALDKLIGNRVNVVIIGETMGALTMWRWAESHPKRASALIGILPACDLTAIANGRWDNVIGKAYGSL